MIAVSSLKPFGLSEAVNRNQRQAYASWGPVFDYIVFFGDAEPGFDGFTTTFWPSEQFPRIKDMAAFNARQPEWSCIINADIIVSPQLRVVERQLFSKRARCAISRRQTFDPETGISQGANVTDMGLDIFCAIPEIWLEASLKIPDQFRIGHCFWDTWMLGFFNTVAPDSFFDFTPSKCIFHPQHGDRAPVHTIDTTKWDKYARAANWPNKKIAV